VTTLTIPLSAPTTAITHREAWCVHAPPQLRTVVLVAVIAPANEDVLVTARGPTVSAPREATRNPFSAAVLPLTETCRRPRTCRQAQHEGGHASYVVAYLERIDSARLQKHRVARR
jgi:hypothetical protein